MKIAVKKGVKKVALWFAVSAISGLIVSQVMLHIIPSAIMAMASDKLFSNQGINRILHAPQVTYKSRKVVRPSPDLIYSICGFDLSNGPLQVSAKTIPDNYWSVSAYAENTDNFWVLNNQQVEENAVTAFIGTKEQISNLDKTSSHLAIISPSSTGVILFRNLVALPEDFVKIDKLRRQSNCKVMID